MVDHCRVHGVVLQSPDTLPKFAATLIDHDHPIECSVHSCRLLVSAIVHAPFALSGAGGRGQI
jgi:hypothetical protein